MGTAFFSTELNPIASTEAQVFSFNGKPQASANPMKN
jgi:hypothetical protein